jgi:hypothetical protein
MYISSGPQLCWNWGHSRQQKTMIGNVRAQHQLQGESIMCRTLCFLIASMWTSVGGTPVARADSYGFYRITSNSPSDVAQQLSVDVSSAGSGLARFRFLNSAEIVSSITDIYFDAATWLSIDSLIGSAGVAFSPNASPPDLPGGNNATPPFVATVGLTADSDPPPFHNGIDSSSEYLDVLLAYDDGSWAFSDILAGLDDGSMRVGVHVQGIGPEGQSDSFINYPNPVPAPGAAILGLVGLSIASRAGRRLG